MTDKDLPCCGGRGGPHTAILNFQSDVPSWQEAVCKAHPGLHLNLPIWQYGPPLRIIGMRVIQYDGPVEVGLNLGTKPFPNYWDEEE